MRVGLNVGAAATDSRLGNPSPAPAGYNFGSAGPTSGPGAWPSTMTSQATPEVKAILGLTLAELLLLGWLRLGVFKKYHGG